MIEAIINDKQSADLGEALESKGERLNHILDVCGFKEGRGRVSGLQQYIEQRCPEAFSGIKYSTVKAWFNDNSPTMEKIHLIVDALSDEYKFPGDLDQVKSWWKVGGFYPFDKKEKDLDEDINGEDSVYAAHYVAQIHLEIYKLSAEIGINPVTDIKSDSLEKVFDKVVNYSKKKNLKVDSDELKNIIISSLRFAKEDLL